MPEHPPPLAPTRRWYPSGMFLPAMILRISSAARAVSVTGPVLSTLRSLAFSATAVLMLHEARGGLSGSVPTPFCNDAHRGLFRFDSAYKGSCQVILPGFAPEQPHQGF